MRTLATALLLVAIVPITTAQPRRPITIFHEFHVSEPGGETITPLKEMSEAQVRAMVVEGCAQLHHRCSQDLENIRPASKIPGMVIAEGQRVYITGQVLRQQGEEWWGIYAAPKGYTACRAAISKMSLAEGSVFDTTIKDHPPERGLLFHAVIASGKSNRPSLISAYFLVQYVPVGTEGRLGCMSDGANPWRCTGPRNCKQIVGTLH